MDISGLITNLIQAELDPAEGARQRLRPGDVLQLQVLEVISANRVKVDLGKFQAMAEIQFPVARGDDLTVSVESVGRQLRLRVQPPVDPAAPQQGPAAGPSTFSLTRFAHTLKQDIGNILNQLSGHSPGSAGLPESVLNAMKAVATHLEPLQPHGNLELLANRLQEKVEASGLFFEKKLEQIVSDISNDKAQPSSAVLQRADRLVRTDLKAQLLVLERFLADPDKELDRSAALRLKELNRSVTGMLTEINEQQKNARQADPNQLFHVVIYDLPIRDSRKNGLLKMYFPKKRRSRDRNSFRLSLLLSMDRLGEIRSDIVLREKDLSLMFFVAGERAKSHIEAQIETVKKKLAAYFRRVSVSVARAEQKLAEFETDPLQADGDKEIDLRV